MTFLIRSSLVLFPLNLFLCSRHRQFTKTIYILIIDGCFSLSSSLFAKAIGGRKEYTTNVILLFQYYSALGITISVVQNKNLLSENRIHRVLSLHNA